MLSVEIQTENLRLVLQTRDETLAFIDALTAAERAEVSPDWLARVRSLTELDPWSLCFAVIHRANAIVVGSCGYNGPPDSDGNVEISYGIDSDHRGKGYATEAAGGRIRYAFDDSRVRVVHAHTFEMENASARVLTKCGFRLLGEVIHPNDGLVWRWQKHREGVAEQFGAPGSASSAP